VKRRNSAPDLLYTDKELWSADPQWLYDIDMEILKFPIQAKGASRQALSLVDK
jgi:hypothetical protein